MPYLKHILFCIFFISINAFCSSQNYQRADSIALTYPIKYNSPDQLAKQIEVDFSNDFDKVRTLYTWIIHNVKYDYGESDRYNFSYTTDIDYQKKQIKYENKLSKRVISRRIAVCEGYSVLFKKICDLLNIKCRQVTGGSKTKITDIGKKYKSDHAWNIVTIDNKDYFIDTTWGISTETTDVDYVYFLTPAIHYIKTHYPDKFKNSLLEDIIYRKEFLNGPLYYHFDYILKSSQNGTLIKKDLGKETFSFSTHKNVTSVSYHIDRKYYTVKSFDNTRGLEFEIDLTNLKNQKKLIFFINNKATIAFRLR